MNRAILFVTIAVGTFSLAFSPRPGTAETKAPASRAGRAIAIEVLIVETKGGPTAEHALQLPGPSDKVAAGLRKLESEGRIVAMDWIRLTTVENQTARFQAGRTAPVASGRSFGGRGSAPQVSYQQRNFGTLVSATAGVHGDAIVVELQVEKSQLERRAGKPRPEDEFVPLGTDTLTSQVTLRIRSGTTVLAGSRDTRTEAESSARLVLASARLLQPSSDAKDVAATEGANKRQIRVFSLQHASAEDAAAVIKELLDDDSGQIRLSVDSRTNSLIVYAEKGQQLDVVEPILLRLDKGDPWRGRRASSDERKSDSTPVVTKYARMEKKDLREELARLQKKALDAERMLGQAREKAIEAAKAYKLAPDDEKADALFQMLEADAATRKPLECHRRIRADFDAAKRAYLNLLVAE